MSNDILINAFLKEYNLKEYIQRYNLNFVDFEVSVEGGILTKPKRYRGPGYTIYDAGFLDVKKRGSF